MTWLSRALVGESGGGTPGEAVCWCMGQRWAFLPSTFPTLGNLLLRYCSPLMPDRAPTEENARWRQRVYTMEPEEIDSRWPGVVDLAIRFCEGRLPMRPQFAGLVHFAQTWHQLVDLRTEELGPPSYSDSGNTFWKVPGTRSWTTETVVPVDASGVASIYPSTTSPLVPLLIGAVLAGGYLAIR